MAACDAIVSLRSPTMGETSGSAIRALSLGKPLVVSDVGWFAELPGDAVVKVPVDEHEEDTLLAALEALADPAVRAAMGARRARAGRARAPGRPRRRGVRRRARAAARAAPPVEERVLHEVATAAGRGRASTATTRPSSRRGCARSVLATSAASASPRARAAELVRASRCGPGSAASSSSPPGSATRSPGGSSRRGSWSTSSSTRSSPRASPTPAASCSAASTPPPTGSSTRRCSARRGRSSTAFPQAYAAAKAINACVVSLAAIPAYLLARRVLSPPVRVRRGRAGDVGPDASLRRDADDRERVLPGVPARRAGDGALARAARPAPDALPGRRVRARVPDPGAGGRDPAGDRDRAVPRLRTAGASGVPLVLRRRGRGAVLLVVVVQVARGASIFGVFGAYEVAGHAGVHRRRRLRTGGCTTGRS